MKSVNLPQAEEGNRERGYQVKFSAKIAALAAISMILVLVLASAVYGKTASDPVIVSTTVDNFISISDPRDINLGAISGTGGSSEKSATWNVATNNDLGYKLDIVSTGSGPAMTKGTDSFADYSGPGTWTIGAAESAFGFSVNGTTNYRGFTGTTPIEIVNSGNETAGEATQIYFKAAIGTSHLQASGSYAANLTVTATTL